MIAKALITAALIWAMPTSSSALSLELPVGAIQTAKDEQGFDSTEVAVGVFGNGVVPKLSVEGSIVAQAWRVPSSTDSTLQTMSLLREQILNAGYDVLLDCAADQCGGFDFRYEIKLLEEPEMHVDLGDFRYFAARRTGFEGANSFIFLVVSRGGDSSFVQMTRIGDPTDQQEVIVTSSKATNTINGPTPLTVGSLETLLTTVGRAPLEDLSFVTGSSRLGEDSFASLAELAKFLISNPDMSVALVGHTDAEGSLVNNMALSKKRAASVVRRLISSYKVPRRQLEAAGVGYLVPRASNLTLEGRTQNRRVEVILTSTR